MAQCPSDPEQNSGLGINIPDNLQPTGDFRYSPANSPVMSPGACVPIHVIRGIPPYTWGVANQGFQLRDLQTDLPSNEICTEECASGSATITVSDGSENAGPPVFGSIAVKEYAFEFDWDNSSQTVSRNGSALVSVKGGIANSDMHFFWSIAEPGYTFSNGQSIITGGPAQTIYADGETCGGCTITITDACGNEASGGLQNESSGKWKIYESCGTYRGGWSSTKIVGAEKWKTYWHCSRDGQPICQIPPIYNPNNIACTGGDSYPCRYTWATCNDSKNPNNYAIPDYDKYKWVCP